MDRSSPNDDDEEEEEDKINKTQFIINILKAAHARRARNPKDILVIKKLASKHIKGLEMFEDLWSRLQLIINILMAAYPGTRKPKDILDGKERASKQINGFKTRKETVGALMLMATLITTVTFAAAFTMPGGFKAEDPHKGKVVLGRNVAFRAFVITDTIAMTSSLMAALFLINMPSLTDEEMIKSFLGHSLFLLLLALMAMGIAFVTGLYAVLSEQLPLAIVVCCIGCILPLLLYGWAPALLPFFQLKES